MLVLMCKASGNRFAVDARQVLEVVPRVRLQSVAGAPTWLAGTCVYRGRILPIVDLAQLATGSACPTQWSSRIILIHGIEEEASLVFGLIVEQAAVAQISSERQGMAPGPGIAPWGPMLLDADGMFQLLELSRLLSAEQRAALLPRALEPTDG